jgi:V8-like Glu-specific endopeptidase
MQFRAPTRRRNISAAITAAAVTLLSTAALAVTPATAAGSDTVPGRDKTVTVHTPADSPDTVRDYWTDDRLKTAGGEQDDLDSESAKADGPVITPDGDAFGYGRPKQPYMRYGTRGVGKLVMMSGDSPSNCSASAIGGNFIVTAAHCIVGPSDVTFLTKMAFVPDYGLRGTYKPFGLWPVTKVYMPTKYYETSKQGHGDFPADVAVMRVANDPQGATLQEVLRTVYKAVQTKDGVPSARAATYGYPGTGGKKFEDGPEMFYCVGDFTDEGQKPVSQLNTTNCAAKGGNSGGPLFDSKWNVIGVAQSAAGNTSFSRLHPDTFGRALTEAKNDKS